MAAGRAAPPAAEAWRRFTPDKVSVQLCLARTWNEGKGGQCHHGPRPGSQFCNGHLRDEKWKVHGSIREPIPDKKLQEFLRAERRAAASVANAGATGTSSSTAAAGSESQAGKAEEISSRRQAARRMLGTFSRTELLEMDAPALLRVIVQKGWQGPKWDALRDGLKRGRLERESAERVLEQQEADVDERVSQELAAAARPQKREAERPARGAKRKAEEPGQAAPPAKGQKAAEGAADTARRRAGGPAAKESTKKAPKEPRAPKCTCGCPIHQTSCALWKPVYKPEFEVKYSSATGVCSGRPGTGRPGAPSAPGGAAPKPPPRGEHAAAAAATRPRLSPQAAERVQQLTAEVAALPASQQRGEWKKKMLLYHPDKRQGLGQGSDMDRDVATEIFMEIKRKVDSFPSVEVASSSRTRL